MIPAQNSTPVFSGEFCHALDVKNRLTIPARWRVSEADEFHLIADRSGQFVKVIPPEQFRAVGDKLASNPAITPKDRKMFVHLFFSKAMHVVLDKQGRMVVPEELIKELAKNARLQGDVMLVGAYDTFELWTPALWSATREAELSTFERVADLIGL